MPDGKTFWGIKLPRPCAHLIETAPREFGCAIYDRRPYVCRIYQGENPDGPQPGCGFHGGPPVGARPAAEPAPEPAAEPAPEPATAASAAPERALVLLYPGAILHEVMLAVDLLSGPLTVEFAAPEPGPLRDASGLRTLPDLTYAAVDPARYRCVLVPGGDPGSVLADPHLERILTGAVARGAVVAGICAGALVLASAGLLRGRRIVHNYRAPWAPPAIESFAAPYWEGAEVDPDTSRLLRQDGPVITALPNGYLELALAVTQALGVHTRAQAEQLARYHRGTPAPR